ncbi:MAG: SPOR domain-containing protein [Pseudomonadota bacterium]
MSDRVQRIERDVEAPEIFSVQDRALWDGRPSLGGIWIAAPDVRTPERVLIRNGENGKTVVGALFKRERDNPGPVLQLSSEAATALGVLAGAPTTLDVVALRREEAPDPVPVVEDLAPVETTTPAISTVEETDIPEMEVGDTTPVSENTSLPVALTDATLLSDAPVDEIAAIRNREPIIDADLIRDEERSAGAFAQRLKQGFRSTRARLLGRFDRVAAPVVAEPVITGAAISAVETTSLDRPAPAAVPTIVQVATFAVERNAIDAATALGAAGFEPDIVVDEAGGRPAWRVIVDPEATGADAADVLDEARTLGYGDAYTTRS